MAFVMATIAVASAVSSIVGGIGASKAAKARAKAMRRQAALQRKQAAKLLEQNQINRFKEARDGAEFKATQITGFVSSGVDVTSGSALQVLADTEAQVIFNDFISNSDAKYKASQIMAGAANLDSKARSADKAGNFALGAGFLSAAGSIAGAASSGAFSSGGSSAGSTAANNASDWSR